MAGGSLKCDPEENLANVKEESYLSRAVKEPRGRQDLCGSSRVGRSLSRCFAALGHVSKARFLHDTNEVADQVAKEYVSGVQSICGSLSPALPHIPSVLPGLETENSALLASRKERRGGS